MMRRLGDVLNVLNEFSAAYKAFQSIWEVCATK